MLDNAPFEPLLRALRERPTDRPYERVLLYVTPSVATTNGDAAVVDGKAPPLGKVLKGVLSAIREPDERLDVDSLKQMFELMGVTSAQPHQVVMDYLSHPDRAISKSDIEAAASKLLPLYRAGRAESLQRKLERHSELSPLQPLGPPRLEPSQVPGDTPEQLEVGEKWRWGAPTADHVLRWWGRALSALQGVAGADYTDALSAVGSAQRTVTDIRAQLIEAIDSAPRNRSDVGTSKDKALESLRTVYDEHRPALLAAVNTAAEAVAQATGHTPADVLEFALAVEVVGFALNWGGAEYDPPRFRYQNLTPAIDPPDNLVVPGVTTTTDWSEKKLFGLRWQHFGAFASQSGREHDWLWGRWTVRQHSLATSSCPLARAECRSQRNRSATSVAGWSRRSSMRRRRVTSRSARTHGTSAA
ncbi:MAG TPA: DUF3376 domain-containing protein [Aldersonia sp.]